MKILLTGGTGTIGGAVLNSLLSSGHEVSCVVRNPSKAAALIPSEVPLLILDPLADIEAQFYSIAKGFANIIHTGYVMTEDQAAIETQVLTGLLNAAKETSASTKVTLIATTGTLLIGETFHLSGEDETSNSNCPEIVKFRVVHEDLVINSNSENLRASIIRPSCVYGGSFVDLYVKACQDSGKIVVPNGNATGALIHKEDLGEVYRLVVENAGTGFFNVSEGLGPNLEQIIELVKSITGVEVVERVENVWEHIAIYGFYLFMLSQNTMIDPKRAKELYGFAPKHNFLRDAEKVLKK